MGRLWRRVLHVRGPCWGDYEDKALCESDLVKTVFNCLREAHALKLKSIALPSVGTGNAVNHQCPFSSHAHSLVSKLYILLGASYTSSQSTTHTLPVISAIRVLDYQLLGWLAGFFVKYRVLDMDISASRVLVCWLSLLG